MCRILFVGTKAELPEVARSEKYPGFTLERISGEFLPVGKVFTNPNIYFVGTSRGCSCDFGIASNQVDEKLVGQVVPLQKFLNVFRKFTGSYEQWERQHAEKVTKLIDDINAYRQETIRLLSIIESEAKKGGKVELYCTWAGEYDAEPAACETIDTHTTDLWADFEVEERVFKTYV